MRKIIIACDSYKGCLTSKEVNEAMFDGVNLLDAGFAKVIAVTPKDMPLQEAMKPEVAKKNIVKGLGILAVFLKNSTTKEPS